MKACRQRLLASLLILLLAGCAAVPHQAELNQNADNIARSAGLARAEVPTDSFVLTSFYRITRADLPLTVYIEGDGFAWRTRSQPSSNPTPVNAQGLALAAADPAANVVYLARPCQFTPLVSSPRCGVSYWTGKRFSEEVVTAMNQAVDQYAARVPGQPLHLVGFSGGANIAALLAGLRQDVITLRSVAGNLDIDEVNRLHRVTPMPDSLNAIDVALRLGNLPQIHYSGNEDKIVPAVIAQRFARAVAGHCTQVREVPGMSHDGNWALLWPKLLAESPRCSMRTGYDQ